MTIKDLQDVTQCRIFIERTDADGAVLRTEYCGGYPALLIREIKIVHVDLKGFVLCVELEDG
jgi:hypothetical protein